MGRFRPVHGVLFVVVLLAGILSAEYVLGGGARRSDQVQVKPGKDGVVRIDVDGLKASEVRFFHFINFGNQEVDFFVARDPESHLQVALDANEICYKKRRGYRDEGEWVVCNSCDKSFRLAEINNGGGGCKPVPLAFEVEGDQVLLREDELLRGWRYFR